MWISGHQSRCQFNNLLCIESSLSIILTRSLVPLISYLLLDRKEKLELWRKFVFGVESIREINPSYATVRMDLNPKGFDVIRSISSAGEVREVKLNLVPSLVKSHWHCADERLHTSCSLIVGSPETSPYILIIKNLNFECEILLQIFDNHDEKWEFNSQGFVVVHWARDVICAHICPHNFEDTGLDIIIGNALNVAIANFLIPKLQRFAPNAVQN